MPMRTAKGYNIINRIFVLYIFSGKTSLRDFYFATNNVLRQQSPTKFPFPRATGGKWGATLKLKLYKASQLHPQSKESREFTYHFKNKTEKSPHLWEPPLSLPFHKVKGMPASCLVLIENLHITLDVITKIKNTHQLLGTLFKIVLGDSNWTIKMFS